MDRKGFLASVCGFVAAAVYGAVRTVPANAAAVVGEDLEPVGDVGDGLRVEVPTRDGIVSWTITHSSSADASLIVYDNGAMHWGTPTVIR